MAYAEKPTYQQDEEDKEKEGGFIQETTGAAPGGVLTAGGAEAPQRAEAPTAGAGVTDISKYLDANREKIQKLGQNVSGVIRGDITSARTGLEGAGTQFKKDVSAGTVQMDQPFFQQAQQSLTDQQNYQTGAAQSFLGTPEQVERFKNLYGATYKGPQDLVSQSYYQPAYTDAQKAIRTAGLVEESPGRQELIARAAPNESGRYSKGVLTLDEALLSGDQETMQAVRAAAAESDIQDRLDALKKMAAEEVLLGQKTTADTKAAMQKEFDLSREEQEIAAEAEKVKAKAQADYEKKLKEIENIKQVFSDPRIGSKQVLAKDYFDTDLYQDIDKYNVASADDYARIKALEELTGVKGGFSQYESKAGQYTKYADPTAAYNEAKYLADVKATKEDWDKNVANLNAYEAEQKRLADEAAARQKEMEKQQTGTAVGSVAGAAIGSVVGGPVGGAVGAVIGGAIGGALCFHPDTPIKMKDGFHKFIRDIQIGDIVFKGGKVYTISSHYNGSPMYDYKGVLVTGSHAVYEDGKWVRVKDSREGILTDIKCRVVFSFSCKNHIIFSDDIQFADYDEIDNAQGLTDEQCLKILNKDI